MICLELFDDLWVLNSIIRYRSTLIRPSRPTHLVDFQHFHKKSVSDEACSCCCFYTECRGNFERTFERKSNLIQQCVGCVQNIPPNKNKSYIPQFDQRGSYTKLLRQSQKFHQVCIFPCTIRWSSPKFPKLLCHQCKI